MYFILYDIEFCNFIVADPMDYNAIVPSGEIKNKEVTFDDIIEYFAEYENYNNLGLIANAHLAKSVFLFEGAKDEECIELANKFARAVDAPKTGEKVKLEESERIKNYPTFMKDNNKFSKNKKRCVHVLQKLYDSSKSEQNLVQNYGYRESSDPDLKNSFDFEPFIFEAFYFYSVYLMEFID